MKETWKEIPEFISYYAASNLGRIKSLERMSNSPNGRSRIIKERILKPGLSGGYYTVDLFGKSGRKTVKVSVLVAMAFLGHERTGYSGMYVDHINEIKTDDRLKNLQLITARKNISRSKKNCSSKYTGVHWDAESCKWGSSIYVNKRCKRLGRFNSELDASNAYQAELKNITK